MIGIGSVQGVKILRLVSVWVNIRIWVKCMIWIGMHNTTESMLGSGLEFRLKFGVRIKIE